jgi:hypothetical protein
MIKVSVLYPNNEGSKFDMSYYCNTHIPMVQLPTQNRGLRSLSPGLTHGDPTPQ